MLSYKLSRLVACPLKSPRDLMQRIVLVNPNTSEPLTALMAEIAREKAPAFFRIDVLTAPFGAPPPDQRSGSRRGCPCRARAGSGARAKCRRGHRQRLWRS